MRFIKSIFWNSHERRVRALWRLSVQQTILLILAVPLQVGLGVAALGMLLSREIITPDQLYDAETMRSVLGPEGLQTLLVESPALMLLFPLALFVPIVLSVWLTGRFADRRPFVDFGLHLDRNWWTDFGFGLFLGAFLMLLIFLIQLVTGWVKINGALVTHNPDSVFIIAIFPPLFQFILVGFHEELYSRGYQLQNLAEGLNWKAIGPRGAILIATLLSSATFGLLHALNPNASFISTFNIFIIGGILLAMGYILTGELAIPIGIHMTWNFFQGNVFGFPVSGGNYRSATFISIQQRGPELWTGGAFGPEAGLLGLLAALLGGLLIVLWVRRRYRNARLHTTLAAAPQRPTLQGEAT